MTHREDIFAYHGQLPKRASHRRPAVHSRQSGRIERRQSMKCGISLSRVGHVIGLRPLLILDEDLPATVEDIRVRDRLNVAVLVKQV
jgi:hypothetical protein